MWWNKYVGLLVFVTAVSINTFAFEVAEGGASKAYKVSQSLDGSAWDASQWISVADAPVVEGKIRDGSRAADGASWFATEIANDKEVKQAVWMTTALGVYDLYVNGMLIGAEVLKPGFTHPMKTRLSFTYDITDAINTTKGGTNAFAAQVTPGWWADKIVTTSGSAGMLGHNCAFRSVVELTYADGSKALFGTDTDRWTAGIAGKVKHAAIFDGEVYDAREKDGWLAVADFSRPVVSTEFDGEIVPSNGAEVYHRLDLALHPVSAYIWDGVENATEYQYGKVRVTKSIAPWQPTKLSKGETLVVDFGQNSAAVPSFVFNAPKGTTLRCEGSELLNDGNGAKSRGMDGPEGSVHRLNLRIPDKGMYIEYTFDASDSPVQYTPRCTFMGYRYVSVTADNDVEIQSICSIPVSSITHDMEIGKLHTGNESINQLISNTLWGQRSNYLSVPTDCPQRNERLGWTADTQVFAETGSFFANTDAFFHKWMRDVRDTQSPAGGYPGVAPYGQYGDWASEMRVGWADAGIIVPWTVWKQYGDTAIINECWQSMSKFIDLIAPVHYSHTELKEHNGDFQFADWLSYEPLESCSGMHRGPEGNLPDAIAYWDFLCASYMLIDAQMMCDMAKATGRDHNVYAEMARETREYIRNEFFNEDGDFKTEILNSMQTPALFALKTEVLDGTAKEKTIARLCDNFKQHGNCLQTGFLGTSILMQTLTYNGMSDVAYELLFQRNNPSWLYSIDNGATTIWERWNSYTLENGMGPRDMNSFNHYAYGCVCQWLWETAAGIAADTEQPGFKHIIMKPIPDIRLGSIDAEYASAAGIIKSAWHYDGDMWIWTFSIPEGATASVTLPGTTTATTYPCGTHTISLPLSAISR